MKRATLSPRIYITHRTSMSDPKDEFEFFWKPHDKNGWMGQWHRSTFNASLSDAIEGAPTESQNFPTAEHWMMCCKAALFGDTETMASLLEANDPKRIKALGRQIKPFDEVTWVAQRERIVFEGNKAKFSQDEDLKKLLLGTEDKVLVEASSLDRIWGIGFSEAKAMENRDRWGDNLLGKALMDVRRCLREEVEKLEDFEVKVEE